MTSYLPKATSVGTQIEKLADEIRDLSGGMPSKDDALAASDTHIEREANSVKIRPSAFTGGAGPAVSAYPRVLTPMLASSSPMSSVPACATKLKPATRAR